MVRVVVTDKNRINKTMAPTAPTSIRGLRTRIRSDSQPTTIKVMISAPQNHWFSPLA